MDPLKDERALKALSLFLLAVIAAIAQTQSVPASDEATQRLLALEKQIWNGRPEAAITIEAELPSLLPALKRHPLTEVVMRIDPRSNLPAMHALARMSLGEENLGGLDGLLSGLLGRSGSLEMLPYLFVMAQSPDRMKADNAAFATCSLLRSFPDLWSPAISANCPNMSPFPDSNQSEAIHRFWEEWWSTHRAVIAQSVNLPEVAVPSRYNQAPRTAPPQPVWTTESRFESLLQRNPDILASEDDRRIFAGLQADWRKRMNQERRRVRTRIDSDRKAGKWMDPDTLRDIQAGHRAILTAIMKDAQEHLSREGWQALEIAGMNMPTAPSAGTVSVEVPLTLQ